MSDVQKISICIWTPLHNHMHEQIIAAKQSCVKCSQSCLVKCSQSSARPSHDTFVIRFQLRPIFGYFHRQIAICWVVATGICHRRQPYLCNHHRRFVPHSLQMENLLCKSCFILEYSQHTFVKLYFRMIWFVFCQKLGLFRWMQFICEWYNGILIQSFEMFFYLWQTLAVLIFISKIHLWRWDVLPFSSLADFIRESVALAPT